MSLQESASFRPPKLSYDFQVLEHAFKNETIGLVTREEFIQKRTTLQERLEEQESRLKQEEEAALLAEKEKRRKAKAGKAALLSFVVEEEEDGSGGLEEETKGATAVAGEQEGPALKKSKYSKLGKDPLVVTDFLPDRDREVAEEELRKQLRKEYMAEQERIRNEPLEVTYSYWDGTGHRKKLTIRKGDSIGTFLKAAREQLASEFRELRAMSVDNLMFIKEDVILPHHYTFYDLMISKARGKSGPLFTFNVYEDIRVSNDATIEKTDSHAGKVVERHWYDKNKHIFPASRWEIYDPEKTYDKYTIYGDK